MDLFFKTEEIKDEFKAKGTLDVLKLTEEERREYQRYLEQKRYEQGLIVGNY